MVDLSDEPPGFRIDQHPKFVVPHPFTWVGPLSKFEDAPFDDPLDSDFFAHAFLCGTGGKLLEAEERPEWSFRPGFLQHPLDP